MEFEFDALKSAANKAKHGIDFEQAQAMWNDEDRLELQARAGVEPRWVMIGRIEDLHWVVVFTVRGHRIRIISARRARREEVEHYESGRL